MKKVHPFVFSFLFTFCLSLTSCYKNEPIPTADFTFSGNNNFTIPCTVNFTNRSTNAFSYWWNFGNDTISTDTNPSFTYNVAGTYTVEFRAYTESRDEWASVRKDVVINDTVK